MGRMRGVALAAAAVALGALLGSCARGPSAGDPGNELLAAEARFAEASAKRGLEGWLSFLGDDAVIFPARGPAVRGIAGVKAYYAKVGFSPEGLAWSPDGVRMAASGDMGFTYGRWTYAGKDGAVVARGKFLTVWTREADGTWKVAADIGNDEPPEPPK